MKTLLKARRVWLVSLLIIVGALIIIGGGFLIVCSIGRDMLGAWGEWVAGCGTVLFALAAVYAGFHAVREYQAKSRTERARWLTELFERFFDENRSYRTIRQKIDFEDFDDILALVKKDNEGTEIDDPGERELFDRFTDYLNFFEYIAYLRETEQLSGDDIKAMFEYYLTRLNRVKHADELLEYIRNNDYQKSDKVA